MRALTRNPAGPVAQQFAREGIQVVRGDFTVKSDLLRAFSGSYAVRASYLLPGRPWPRVSGIRIVGGYLRGVGFEL